MSNKSEPKKILATAKFKDFEAYRAWWLSEDKDFDWMANFMDTHTKDPGAQLYMPHMDSFYRNDTFIRYSDEEAKERARRERVERTRKEDIPSHLSKLEALINYAEAFNQALNINWLTDTGAYVCLHNPENGFYVAEPYVFLDIEMVPDYSDLTIAQMRALPGMKSGGASSTLPANVDESISVSETKERAQAMQDQIKQLKQEMEDVDHCKTGELAELKAELERMEQNLREKKQAVMAELERKKEEMQAQIDQMNRQVYLLESEIYAIRCYLGETVSFAKVRSGKNAPDTEPIILHQKLRFLDEDLARLVSIYELEWDDRSKFEHFLAHSPHALDTFAPNERCVTLVRLSRTNKRYAPHEKIRNALDIYEAYHGRSVGIIIRNGENMYMGWTDDEKVHIQDDFIMNVKPRMVDEEVKTEESEWDRKRRLEREQAEAATFLDGIISRVFIFNILQGIVDSSDILPLPKGEKISRQSEYVQFSVADLWLTDNRFGSFSDIVARCNSKISVGDHVLSVQHLTAGRDFYASSYYRGPDTWINDRGRGDRNRTRDCSISDCTIYPINLIEQDEPIPMVRYRYPNHHPLPGEKEWHECTTRGDGANLSDEAEILERYEQVDTHYYVSVEKEWSDCGARSNFEINPSEMVNLQYMNSVWLAYAISNQKLGGWSIGGRTVDYAFAIRYLNTAMDFIRRREAGEKRLLDAIDPAYTANNSEWPLALSEWKMEKGVRNITEYQAKRFVKHIQETHKRRD